MQFWPVSLQNGLKMCVFLRSITWATGCHEDQLQLVTLTGFFIFKGQATTTDSPVVVGFSVHPTGPLNTNQLYQGIVKHMVGWVTETCGSEEVDARCRRFPPKSQPTSF